MKYFDNAATTQVLPTVKSAIIKALDLYGNPSATMYDIGMTNKLLIENCKTTILSFLGADRDDLILFTSSASESNSTVLKSFETCLTSSLEHKSIYGLNKSHIGVDKLGNINNDELSKMCREASLTSDNYLVSIQGANNELGNVQHISTISKIVHNNGGFYHCDATQLIPYVRVKVKELGIDALSFSGHKIGCPKGIGVLYLNKDIAKHIKPLIYGAQEYGLRGGTENLPYIVGLQEAIIQLNENLEDNRQHVFNCNQYLSEKLYNIPDIKIINEDMVTTGSVLSVAFKNVPADTLVAELNDLGFAISAGSACNTSSIEPSYVLKNIGVSDEYLYNTIRISFSGSTSFEDIDALYEAIETTVNKTRKFLAFCNGYND